MLASREKRAQKTTFFPTDHTEGLVGAFLVSLGREQDPAWCEP